MKDVLLFLGGALVSWAIAAWYYAKASADQRAELERLRGDLKPRNTLLDFERRLVAGAWDKKFIDGVERWVCRADSSYQMRKGETGRDFSEPWINVHPDKSARAIPVFLSIGGNDIHELMFVSADGGRVFVPVTRIRRLLDGAVEYYWSRGSLEVKVCRVIGEYYIYKNLEELAKVSNVLVENSDA